MKNIKTLIAGCILAASLTLSPSMAQEKKILLVDMNPEDAEFGMLEGNPWGLATGPGVIDLGSWGGRVDALWSGPYKIIKQYPDGFTLKEGEVYSSGMENSFAVEGEFKTGVGLWARSNAQYHWIEYSIPNGATKFSGQFFFTDDVWGANNHSRYNNSPANHGGVLKIFIDEKEVEALPFQYMQLMPGGGFLLTSIDLDIPEGAKKIRFYLDSGFLQDNMNNEIVINDAYFSLK